MTGGGSSNTCYAYGSDGSCLSTTSDGGMTVVGCGTNTSGACAPKPGTPAASNVTSVVPTPVSSIASIFTSVGTALGTKPLAAGAAVPSGYVNLGGTLVPTTTLLLGGAAIFLLVSMKGRR